MDRSIKLLLLAVVYAVVVLFAAIVFIVGMDSFDLMVQALLFATMMPLFVMSAYMWVTGKGAMLIAGYNTSPRAVREMYDNRAMAKYVGKLLAISMIVMLTGLEALVLAGNNLLFWALFIISIGILLSGMYYMNTGNKFLKEGVNPKEVEMMANDRKFSRKVVFAALAVTAIIIVLVFILVGSGSVSASLEGESLHVNAPMVNEQISYRDVTAIELRNSYDDGHRIGGFGGTVVSSGHFQNDEFGTYILARYNSVGTCIVVHHTNGVLVFNLDSTVKTTQLYNDMRSSI
jgi:hypothetical protein